jgi:CheY-like chemotaxis protein
MDGGEAKSAAAADSGPKRTILIVEDHLWTRYTAADYLRAAGYRVVEASNAEEAISALSSGKPIDVVFSDINMPGSMDGLGLAAWIGQHHPGMPVLLTSGYRPPLLPAVCRAFFVKPCSLADLEQEIRGTT